MLNVFHGVPVVQGVLTEFQVLMPKPGMEPWEVLLPNHQPFGP